MVTSLPKNIDRWDDDRLATDYMRKINLRNSKIWFRYRSRITVKVKANSSSAFTYNMECRHFKSGEVKS